jgi:hypothetical protein
MIYLFHGNDVEKTRTKAFEWVAKARAKEPNLAYVRLDDEETTDSSLEESALSGGLFVKRLLILIDDPFQEESSADLLEKHLTALADSDNAIVILAPKLAAAKAKKIATKAKVVYKYDLPAQAGKPERGFNSNLVNALANRSREKLWLEINRALRAGDAPEMLHGLLHWKARDLLSKPGLLNTKWKPNEPRLLSLQLIELLQSSRRGGLDLSLSLEKFALSV